MDIELDPVKKLLHCWETFGSKSVPLAHHSLEDGLENGSGLVIADEAVRLKWWRIGIWYGIVLDLQKQRLLRDGIGTSEKEIASNSPLLAMKSANLCLEKLLGVGLGEKI
jgi:hypothetical protein